MRRIMRAEHQGNIFLMDLSADGKTPQNDRGTKMVRQILVRNILLARVNTTFTQNKQSRANLALLEVKKTIFRLAVKELGVQNAKGGNHERSFPY